MFETMPAEQAFERGLLPETSEARLRNNLGFMFALVPLDALTHIATVTYPDRLARLRQAPWSPETAPVIELRESDDHRHLLVHGNHRLRTVRERGDSVIRAVIRPRQGRPWESEDA